MRKPVIVTYPSADLSLLTTLAFIDRLLSDSVFVWARLSFFLLHIICRFPTIGCFLCKKIALFHAIRLPAKARPDFTILCNGYLKASQLILELFFIQFLHAAKLTHEESIGVALLQDIFIVGLSRDRQLDCTLLNLRKMRDYTYKAGRK